MHLKNMTLFFPINTDSTDYMTACQATYLHNHKDIFLCLDHMIELANMLMGQVLHRIYFTLYSW